MVDDGLPANDYKDLHSHAYLIKAGHIKSISVVIQGEKHIFQYIRLSEMKQDTVYKLNLLMNNKGQIQTATCGCPAGVGPTGGCKHISPLCYALIELRNCASDGHAHQYWNQPQKQKLDHGMHVPLTTQHLLSTNVAKTTKHHNL